MTEEPSNSRSNPPEAASDSQPRAASRSGETAGETPQEPKPTALPKDLLADSQLTPLNKTGTVLLDLPGKRILLKAEVCLTIGQLEMLVCLKQTKEHESILTLDGEAFTIHGALIALGAKEGTPAKYDPKYEPATGQPIDIFLHFVDVAGKLRRERAQNWVRHTLHRFFEDRMESLPADLKLDPDGNLRYDPVNKYLIWYGPMTRAQRDELLLLSKDEKYQKAIEKFFQASRPREMAADWVFVGSGFSEDPEAGKRYQAEGGYVICVANFPMSMIDVSVESSSTGSDSLSFEAWTERIPPRGSEVLVELVPRFEKEAKSDAAEK